MWRDWLSGMTVTPLAGNEILVTGLVADQVALLGIINHLHSLNVMLLAICCCEPLPNAAGQAPTSPSDAAAQAPLVDTVGIGEGTD